MSSPTIKCGCRFEFIEGVAYPIGIDDSACKYDDAIETREVYAKERTDAMRIIVEKNKRVAELEEENRRLREALNMVRSHTDITGKATPDFVRAMNIINSVETILNKIQHQEYYAVPAEDLFSIKDKVHRRKVWKEHRQQQRDLNEEFKKDALDALGISDHEKADRAFELAWEYGHAYGFMEVFRYLEDLSELLFHKSELELLQAEVQWLREGMVDATGNSLWMTYPAPGLEES